MNFFDTLIAGFSSGSVYALIALGYTMVYGIAKMLNFAHGDIMMVGAFAVEYVVWEQSIIVFQDVWLALIVSMMISIIVCIALGVIIEKLAYKPLRGASPLAVLITAIGVSYLLRGIAQIYSLDTFNKTSVQFNYFKLKLGNIQIGSSSISIASVITFGVTIAIMIGLIIFINKSKTGKSMLAVSEDKLASKLMGINVNKTITTTFIIGSAIAAVSALFNTSIDMGITSTYGAKPGIFAFTAAVIGGIGSIPGAMIGGFVIGILEQVAIGIPAIGNFVVGNYADTIIYLTLIIILLVKPNGLFGKVRMEKV